MNELTEKEWENIYITWIMMIFEAKGFSGLYELVGKAIARHLGMKEETILQYSHEWDPETRTFTQKITYPK